MQTCFASLVSNFDPTFFSFSAIVVKGVHTVCMVWQLIVFFFSKVNSYIIHVYKLYVDFKSGNLGEILVDYWDVLVSYKLFH